MPPVQGDSAGVSRLLAARAQMAAPERSAPVGRHFCATKASTSSDLLEVSAYPKSCFPPTPGDHQPNSRKVTAIRLRCKAAPSAQSRASAGWATDRSHLPRRGEARHSDETRTTGGKAAIDVLSARYSNESPRRQQPRKRTSSRHRSAEPQLTIAQNQRGNHARWSRAASLVCS